MEINANPSLNMYLEWENEDGEHEKILSELDKHLKTTVVSDAIKIVKAKKQLDDLGSYTQILPSNNALYESYDIWNEANRVFDVLVGKKENQEYISSSAF